MYRFFEQDNFVISFTLFFSFTCYFQLKYWYSQRNNADSWYEN